MKCITYLQAPFQNSKARFQLLFLLTLVWILPAQASYDLSKLQPTRVQQHASLDVVTLLKQLHYNKVHMNDLLSERVFDRYLKVLDPNRSYFLQSDIDDFSKFRFQIDEALQTGNLAPAFIIFNRYQERLVTRLDKVIAQLDEGLDQFDFTKKEEYLIDRGEAAWPKTEAEMDDLWRKRLKHLALQLKLRGKEDKDIQSTLSKRFKNMLSRTMQANNEDAFQIYINAFTHIYDPHTTYFTPRESENFDINMSLQLQGIGAVLQSEDEYTKVVRLVSGGPADKNKQLKPADKIVGVGQQGEEIIDVVGWRLDEVVDRIRGKKGTVVNLEVIPAGDQNDGKTKIISIKRDTVKLEDRAAQSTVLEVPTEKGVKKFGVINIPAFYHDFQGMQDGDPNYRSSTRDVKRLITELKKQNIDGLIIDLRNNGGGSLQEAQKSVGLFIPTGPVVQVKSYKGVEPIADIDPKVFYDGPLAVVVNRLSASASEIFAGAIQDYNRGIVVGERTFGKGTVQSLQPLDHGKLKITLAKFYRISGESNQHQGIVPDISFPSLIDFTEIGESALDNALPSDKIRPAYYHAYQSIDPIINYLKAAHEERSGIDPDFIYVEEQIKNRDEIKSKDTVSLNEKTRLEEIEASEQRRLDAENRKRIAKQEKPFKDIEELKAFNEEEASEALSTVNTVEIDYVLKETGHILEDMISLSAPKSRVAVH
ncbi:MAG: carboxy terminal-processing peptidase [Pseudomonadales bacterium]|nr:carboxy terminal-processing peptidase [Pseudomonadales bacterium]